MKERPILFSGPMVRAILDGRKTQTRRVITPQPDFVIDGKPLVATSHKVVDLAKRCLRTITHAAPGKPYVKDLKWPHGPGDRLWVRERGMIAEDKSAFMYRDAGGKCAPGFEGTEHYGRIWKPCSSIHMPRWASRITLEITTVRVERLQEISEEDVLAEGFAAEIARVRDLESKWNLGSVVACDVDSKWLDWWRVNWDKINGKKNPWNSNPWVWVISFRRLNEGETTRVRIRRQTQREGAQ